MKSMAPDDRALVLKAPGITRSASPAQRPHERLTVRRSGSAGCAQHLVQSPTPTVATKVIRAEEIRLGDIIVCGGDEHRINRIDRRGGWAWPIAADERGWAIALGDYLIEVRRIAVTVETDAKATAGPRRPSATAGRVAVDPDRRNAFVGAGDGALGSSGDGPSRLAGLRHVSAGP
jgi:hypothetical protein